MAVSLYISNNDAAAYVQNYLAYPWTVTHGRSQLEDGLVSSTFSFRLYNAPTIYEMGNVSFSIDSVSRFTGVITDVTPLIDKDDNVTVQYQAIGRVRLLSERSITSTAGMAANVTDRGVLDEFALEWNNNFSETMTVEPFSALYSLETLTSGVTKTAAEWLAQWQAAAEIVCVDTPDGGFYVSSIPRRGDVGTSFDIPQAQIAAWPSLTMSDSDILNEITLTNTTTAVSSSDPGSIAAFGTRTLEQDTTLNSASLTSRLRRLMDWRPFPSFKLGSVTVPMHNVTDATLKTNLVSIISGQPVVLKGLPTIYPLTDYPCIVEGWSETYEEANGNVYHWLTLAISDPRPSSANTLKMQDFPAGFKGSSIPSGVKGYELVTLESVGL